MLLCHTLHDRVVLIKSVLPVPHSPNKYCGPHYYAFELFSARPSWFLSVVTWSFLLRCACDVDFWGYNPTCYVCFNEKITNHIANEAIVLYWKFSTLNSCAHLDVDVEMCVRRMCVVNFSYDIISLCNMTCIIYMRIMSVI